MLQIRTCLSVFCLSLVTVANSLGAFAKDDIKPEQLEFFEKRIRPVLVQQCYSCHSKDAKSIKGGLVLDTREGIQRGGDSGHAVVPGDLDSSTLMEAIRYESVEMPPDGQLSDEVIADFAKWIEMGAPDPRSGPTLIKREIKFEEAKQHWAFQPIKKTETPAILDSTWPRSAVDQFVFEKLNAAGLQPVADADRLKLVRRLYYDLIGLPPTPAQLEKALADSSPQAIPKLVDELLDSPQFGERWGRHWLDVVRYAESNGRERNFVYPNAWRYRDYVIAAFNADKPFDQFVREQIAGDLLENPENEQLVATGFLAIGPKLLNERNREEFVMDLVDEQVDITTRAFMGLTVSCARCHDHKFDPIPTAEYYSMAGIFRSTDTLYGTKQQGGNRQGSGLVSLKSENEDPAAAEARAEKRKIDALNQLEAAKKNLSALQARNKKLAQQKKNSKETRANPKAAAQLKKSIANARKRVQALQKQAVDGTGGDDFDKAMGVRDGKVADSPVYIRGEVGSPKGKSPRGFLTILDPHLKQPLLENDQSGRLELADWIVSHENPLTARVTVNRVWSHLFGSGIVRTVDNFGATGEPPTHPQLLDFLATRFAEQGWSIKQLVRELVLSRTYQMSGDFDPKNYQMDPDNQLLWRHQPQRVDAEALRDALLLASGNLDLEPAEGSPVSELNGEYGRQVSVGQMLAGNKKRSVYLPIIRNAVPEALKLFDFAEPSILVGERSVTTVPTQALFFLNSKFVAEQCDALATKLLTNENLDDEQRVDIAYQSILARPATGSEVERATQFVQRTIERLAEDGTETSGHRQLAWSSFCQALFGSAEFRYVE